VACDPDPRGPPRTNSDAPSDEGDDALLFRRAVADVRPLPDRPPPPAPPPPPPRARFRRADDAAALAESLTLGPGERLVESGEEVAFRRARLAPRVLDRLRRGEYRVVDEIDLHGMSAAEARSALGAFLLESRRRDRRCLRVIHGKGRRSGPRGPVLKQAVQVWLRQHDPVLAFASARNVDGGTGALYVLLEPER
jgi:DNA-nicking Smr family endonuclease